MGACGLPLTPAMNLGVFGPEGPNFEDNKDNNFRQQTMFDTFELDLKGTKALLPPNKKICTFLANPHKMGAN